MSKSTLLRYPGGKSRQIQFLLPRLKPWLQTASAYHDVFIGGGSMLLAVAAAFPNLPIFANDLDETVYHLWALIGRGNPRELEELFALVDRPATLERFDAERARSPEGMGPVDLAYRCLFFNRTTYGGIAYASPIGGRAQDGRWRVDYHWHPKKTTRQIRDIVALLRGRLTVSNDDALTHVDSIAPDAVAYLDPPYYEVGDDLYCARFTPLGATALSQRLRGAPFRWLLSYNDHAEVRKMYESWAGVQKLLVGYSSSSAYTSQWKQKTELVITREGNMDPAIAARNLVDQFANDSTPLGAYRAAVTAVEAALASLVAKAERRPRAPKETTISVPAAV